MATTEDIILCGKNLKGLNCADRHTEMHPNTCIKQVKMKHSGSDLTLEDWISGNIGDSDEDGEKIHTSLYNWLQEHFSTGGIDKFPTTGSDVNAKYAIPGSGYLSGIANKFFREDGSWQIINSNPATTNTLGTIKLGSGFSYPNYPILLDSNNKAYVNVPWTDTLPIYDWDDNQYETLQIAFSNIDDLSNEYEVPSEENNRIYPVFTTRSNSKNKLFVQVPWLNTIYTAGNNINISASNVISATDTQYTAGNNITIDNNTISTYNLVESDGIEISTSSSNKYIRNTNYSLVTYDNIESVIPSLELDKIYDQLNKFSNVEVYIKDDYNIQNPSLPQDDISDLVFGIIERYLSSGILTKNGKLSLLFNTQNGYLFNLTNELYSECFIYYTTNDLTIAGDLSKTATTGVYSFTIPINLKPRTNKVDIYFNENLIKIIFTSYERV